MRYEDNQLPVQVNRKKHRFFTALEIGMEKFDSFSKSCLAISFVVCYTNRNGKTERKQTKLRRKISESLQ